MHIKKQNPKGGTGWINFNIVLVNSGYSPYYTEHGPSQKYDYKFRDAEKYAEKAHKVYEGLKLPPTE